MGMIGRLNRKGMEACLGGQCDEAEASSLFTSHFHNPLESPMPNEGKEKSVSLLNRREIPIIEDDVFSDLHNGKGRPNSVKVYDEKDMVPTAAPQDAA